MFFRILSLGLYLSDQDTCPTSPLNSVIQLCCLNHSAANLGFFKASFTLHASSTYNFFPAHHLTSYLYKSSVLKMMHRASAEGSSSKNGSINFDCNICLENVKDPMVTLCGHLYCWPCIYKWLNANNSTSSKNTEKPQCPVCKLEISESTLVPLYGCGQTASTSKGKAHQEGFFFQRQNNIYQEGTIVPPRPLCPSSCLSKLSPRSHDTATVS